MATPQIKTLAEAEEMIKENPCVYLVAFITAKGEYGSALLTMKEDAPAYKAYFIFNEANKDGQLFTIISVTKLTADQPEVINVGIDEVQRKRLDMIKSFEEEAAYFDLPPGSRKTLDDFIADLKQLI